ncbi:hypothetical protein [Streptomyces sp. NPDC014006]|uniref:hypothetical protein n=1 Tax=Streptomyces sp. NPDC014006 TaxID=3364870 RepID=UPI003701220F
MPAQQWLLEGVLRMEPLPEGEAAQPARRSQDERWAAAAARQFQAREGHLNVPRKHAEIVEHKLGPSWTTPGAGPPGSPRNAAPSWMHCDPTPRRRAPMGTRSRQ